MYDPLDTDNDLQATLNEMLEQKEMERVQLQAEVEQLRAQVEQLNKEAENDEASKLEAEEPAR